MLYFVSPILYVMLDINVTPRAVPPTLNCKTSHCLSFLLEVRAVQCCNYRPNIVTIYVIFHPNFNHPCQYFVKVIPGCKLYQNCK